MRHLTASHDTRPRVGISRIRAGFALAGFAVAALMGLTSPRTASASFCDGCSPGLVFLPCPKPVGVHPSNVFPIIVTSPFGPLAGQGPYQVVLHDKNGVSTPAGTVIWLETTAEGGLFMVSPNHCDGAECGNPAAYPYDEQATDATGTASYTVGFSGHGFYGIEYEYECEATPEHPCTGPGYYGPLSGGEVRSTDMVGSPTTNPVDGDTDQDDKLNLGRLIKNGGVPSSYDYNLDGVVDGADYAIVANEYLRENFSRTLCHGPDSGPFVTDTSAPGAVTNLSKAPGTGNVITLRWTAPGDDTDGSNGQIGMAALYDLRCSPVLITSANFASATPVDPAPPSPSLAGTQDQVTVDRCALNAKYWALKTRDWKGNWSAISNVLYTGANCFATAHEVARDLPLEFAITKVHLDPGASDATIALAVPAGERGPASLDVLDIAGRLVARLFDGELPAGTHTFHWDLRSNAGTSAAQGMYVIRAHQGSNSVTHKFILSQ